MTEKKLVFRALPKCQMGRKATKAASQLHDPSALWLKRLQNPLPPQCYIGHSRSFLSERRVWKHYTTGFQSFQLTELSKKKMVEPYLLPELEVIVDDSLRFTVKVYGSYLVDDHPLYVRYRRSTKNVTLSNLLKELESYQLCDRVQTLELSSKLFHHVVPINHDSVKWWRRRTATVPK